MPPGRAALRGAGVVAALLVGLLPALAAQGPLIGDPWVAHDDARQVVYQARLAHQGPAFAADPNAVHSRIYLPGALAGLYRAVAPVLDPLTVTKLLPLALSPLLALALFAVGRRVGGTAAGLWAAAALTLVTWTRWPPMWGAGDAGEWLAPLQGAMLWALVARRPIAAAAVAVAAAHLYPPAFLLVATAWGLCFLAGSRSAERAELRRELAWGLGAALVAVGMLIARTGRYDDAYGALFSLAEARSMVEFGPEGRTPIFQPSFLEQLASARGGLAVDASVFLLVVVTVLVALFAALPKQRSAPRLPAALWATLAAGLGWWIVSLELVFLYQPARFTIVTLPLVCAVVLGTRLSFLLAGIERVAARRTAVATAALFGFAFYGPHVYASHVRAEPRALFEALRELPEDALIAGPPRLLDQVPAFAGRRVLVSDEMIAPMFRERYAEARELMREMLLAYHGSESARIDELCRRRGVTHWIVDGRDFDGRLREPYFPPFEAAIQEARAGEEAPVFSDPVTRGFAVVASVDVYRIVECPSTVAAVEERRRVEAAFLGGAVCYL